LFNVFSEYTRREMSGLSWQLVAPLLAGEQRPDAVELCTELYAEMHASLLRYGTSLGLRDSDAEDVVQESFLKLFHHLRAGKDRSNLRGWVFRVLHHAALRRRMESAREWARNAATPEDVTNACPLPNPEQQLVERDKQARLQAVIQALAERDRCCLLLRGEGLRYREIAETLDMSLGAVAQSLTRSLEKLERVRER
jgi:RNA polymerase sigma-70 factor (ECF subfamily)